MQKMVKASFQGAGEYLSYLYSSKCVMPISVGQAYHERQYFHKQLKLIEQRLASCEIVVCDVLQRHTLPLSNAFNDIDYAALAIKAGDEWLERNYSEIQQLRIPYQVRRWSEWLDHPSFMDNKSKLLHAINTDVQVKHIFEVVTHEFLTRFTKHTAIAEKHQSRAFSLVTEYLVEECAIMPLWTSLNAQFEAYPSSRSLAMRYAYETFVKPDFPELLKWLRINFRSESILHVVLDT